MNILLYNSKYRGYYLNNKRIVCTIVFESLHEMFYYLKIYEIESRRGRESKLIDNLKNV